MSVIRELLRVCEGDKQKAREIFGKTEKDVQTDLDILLQWLEKQSHLPKPHDKTRLEAYLLRNKFRVEQTKHKLDKYYTYRGLYSDFFVNLDPTSVAMQNMRKSLQKKVGSLPVEKQIPSGTNHSQDRQLLHIQRTVLGFFPKRGSSFRRNRKLEESVDVGANAETAPHHGEVELRQSTRRPGRHLQRKRLVHLHADIIGVAVDTRLCEARYILKLVPSVVTKGFFLLEKALSGRIIAVEYINLPPTIDYILVAVKQLLNAKLFNRIKTHTSLECLYKAVPKEYLPEEYGGNEGELSVLHEKWGKELILQRDFLMENAKMISDERLRMGEPFMGADAETTAFYGKSELPQVPRETGTRLQPVNYFNLPPSFEYVLGILKQVLKPKFFNKITTHKTLESLYEVVPKEYLPKDYGEEQESLGKMGQRLEFQKD